MPIDPVQSIRVATNLAERFGALMKPGSMEVAELELKIGEAQQLYPEIWRHLDDARTALAQQGRDVSYFDELRRGELAQLGVTEIESTTTIDYAALIGGALRTAQVKTATFNTAGYRRALEGCNALMAAMPEVDWKAVAHAEEREIREAGSLHTAKWKGGAKAIVIAAAVIGVGVIVYRVMTSIEAEPAVKSATQQQHEAKHDAVDRQREQQRFARIAELKETYAASCDRMVKVHLVRLLRDASQLTEADKIESTPCVPVRPSCDAVKEQIGARIASGFELAQDKGFALTCQGILLLRGGGGYDVGFAVVVSGKDRAGHVQTLRGVTAVDGARDLVTFGPAPGTRLAAVGDIDHDSSEELVFVDSTSLTVSSVKGPGFVDFEGPAMPKGCAADVNIEGDFRNGRKGELKRLVLAVPDGVGKRCLVPGRHYFELRRDGLSEID